MSSFGDGLDEVGCTQGSTTKSVQPGRMNVDTNVKKKLTIEKQTIVNLSQLKEDMLAHVRGGGLPSGTYSSHIAQWSTGTCCCSTTKSACC